jgi:hypothetical protein
VPELPPPLPPAERTMGQLVGETIRAYGSHFWRALPLGLPIAIVDQLSVHEPLVIQALLYWAAAPLLAGAYVWACSLVLGARPTWLAFGVALVVYLPFPLLRALAILPGVAWFAYIGLAVPAALVEGTGMRASLRRGRELGTADYVHALGSLATLVIVVGVGEQALTAVLHSQGGNSQRAALFLAGLVLTPLLYLGGALLYTDQAARVGSRRPHRRRRRDADLHPPVDADSAGRADPQVEP